MRLAIAMMLVSAAAFADPAAKPKLPDAKQMHADDCAKARAANRTCVLDMSGETVDGAGVTPNGSTTTVIRFPPNSSLIHVRTEFIEQILRTAEDL
ncbi:MAG TPA: hypothetical protein VH143_27120 [Kofleriaceae bacterium]|jgi:hypothetical protein|nr:hypothetical protein [Kofleriaceae bacterium]